MNNINLNKINGFVNHKLSNEFYKGVKIKIDKNLLGSELYECSFIEEISEHSNIDISDKIVMGLNQYITSHCYITESLSNLHVNIDITDLGITKLTWDEFINAYKGKTNILDKFYRADDNYEIYDKRYNEYEACLWCKENMARFNIKYMLKLETFDD